MRTLRSADLMTGALTIVIGLATLVASRSIKAMAGESLDPRTLPSIVGWAMVLCGAGIMYTGWRYRGDPVPVHMAGQAGAAPPDGDRRPAAGVCDPHRAHRLPHRHRRLCRGPLLVPGPLPALGHHSGGRCDRGHRVLRVHGVPGAHVPARAARIPALAREMNRQSRQGRQGAFPGFDMRFSKWIWRLAGYRFGGV